MNTIKDRIDDLEGMIRRITEVRSTRAVLVALDSEDEVLRSWLGEYLYLKGMIRAFGEDWTYNSNGVHLGWESLDVVQKRFYEDVGYSIYRLGRGQ